MLLNKLFALPSYFWNQIWTYNTHANKTMFQITPIQDLIETIERDRPKIVGARLNTSHLTFISNEQVSTPNESIDALHQLAKDSEVEFNEEQQAGFQDFVHFTKTDKCKSAILNDEQKERLRNNTRHIIHFLKTKADHETKQHILSELAEAGVECSHSHLKATETICKTYIFKRLGIPYFKLDIQREFLYQLQEKRIEIFKRVIAKEQKKLNNLLEFHDMNVTKDSGYLGWTHLFANSFGLDPKLGVRVQPLEESVATTHVLRRLNNEYLKEILKLAPKKYTLKFQEWVDLQKLDSKKVYHLSDFTVRRKYQFVFLISIGVLKSEPDNKGI